MTAFDLIDRAHNAGLKLSPVPGGRLRIRGPKPLPADLVDQLKRHKAEVLSALEAERSPEDVGPWQPPGAIPPHRQCPSCNGGLQPDDPDGDLCGTCRWSFQHLEPRRVQ